jgi:hypothetical protein
VERTLSAPRCEATGVGALPHTDPVRACAKVLDIFPNVPYAPTLPNKSPLEAIVFSDSEHVPALTIEQGKIRVDTGQDHAAAMEQIFFDYMEGNYAPYAAGEAYASGFHAFVRHDLSGARIAKAQLTGPITFGMQVVDTGKRPIHYNPEYADLLNKLMALRARWYEASLRAAGAAETLVVLNEPYLASLGSSVVPIDEETVRSAFTDAMTVLEGALGVHCCANTDWAYILSLEPAFVSLDAYSYATEFLLYPDELAAYYEKGGVVGWGLIPAEFSSFAQESIDSLYARYCAIRGQVCDLIDPRLFLEQSLITPTCGIRFATEEQAEDIMKAASALSRMAREEGP